MQKLISSAYTLDSIGQAIFDNSVKDHHAKNCFLLESEWIQEHLKQNKIDFEIDGTELKFHLPAFEGASPHDNPQRIVLNMENQHEKILFSFAYSLNGIEYYNQNCQFWSFVNLKLQIRNKHFGNSIHQWQLPEIFDELIKIHNINLSPLPLTETLVSVPTPPRIIRCQQ